MHPILFTLGPIEVRFYGLMYVVAIVVGSYIIGREVRRKELPLTSDNIMNFVVWCVIGGIVVARLYYVAFNWDFYSEFLMEIPAVWHGGLAIHGGVMGGFTAGWLYLNRTNVPFWKMADSVAPALILGQAFGRFGNFMNGDAHGVPTTMPWGIVFPIESIAGNEFPGLATHPTMLYEMIINISIFLLIWFVLRKKDHKPGFIFTSYLVLYSAGRFFVEHFRADSLVAGSLRAAQVASIILIVVAGFVIIRWRLWRRL